MTISKTHPLEAFHKFVGAQLQQPHAPLMSPEEALARWRAHQESLGMIREGLADIEAGRTRPAEEMLQELKARLPGA